MMSKLQVAEIPFTAAIFDCDGTLLNSLGAWRGMEEVLARSSGITVTPEERALFTTFTIPEVSEYFHNQHGLGASAEDVKHIIDDYMMDYYTNQATLLPGVAQFLDQCARRGIAMSVASSSAPAYLEAGLRAAGVRDYFTAVVSVDEIESSKREPRIYHFAAERMGSDKTTTWGFEDSLYAVRTLKGAGFPTVAVYDESENITFEELSSFVDLAIYSFEDIELTPENLLQVH